MNNNVRTNKAPFDIVLVLLKLIVLLVKKKKKLGGDNFYRISSFNLLEAITFIKIEK